MQWQIRLDVQTLSCLTCVVSTVFHQWSDQCFESRISYDHLAIVCMGIASAGFHRPSFWQAVHGQIRSSEYELTQLWSISFLRSNDSQRTTEKGYYDILWHLQLFSAQLLVAESYIVMELRVWHTQDLLEPVGVSKLSAEWLHRFGAICFNRTLYRPRTESLQLVTGWYRMVTIPAVWIDHCVSNSDSVVCQTDVMLLLQTCSPCESCSHKVWCQLQSVATEPH